MIRSWRTWLFLWALMVLVPTQVLAQNAEFERASAQAKAAFEAGRFDEAAGLFKEAFSIEPRGNLLYNIGLCHERAGDLANAIVFYQRFVEANPQSPKRPAVQRQIEDIKIKLEGQYEEVTVTTNPPGGVVFVDDKAKGALGVAPVTFKLLPGKYTLIVELTGYEAVRRPFELSTGSPANLDISLMSSEQVGSVSLLISERDAAISIDGKSIGRSPLAEPLRLKQGSHEVTVLKPGFNLFKQQIQVNAGSEQRVSVDLKNEGGEADLAQQGDEEGGGGGQLWPWVTVGVGAAAIGAGVYTGLSANSLYSQLEDKQDKAELIASSDIDTGKNLVMMTNVLLGVGTAAVAGGLVWWWLAADDGVDTKSNISASAGATPDGSAAFFVVGAF